jgi:uncharacterized delta-60 repeat protein
MRTTTPALATAILLTALSGLAQAAPGDLDPTFDGDGMRTFGTAGGDTARAVLVQPDGKLVLAGFGNSDFVVARLDPNGISDLSFDGGMAGADFGDVDFGNAAALQPDGKIVVAGYTQATDSPPAIARLNADGSPDVTFGGGDGKVTIDFGVATFGQAAALQANGRILVAGQMTGVNDFAIARLRG